MSRDKWVDFFTEARIPLGAAKQYAKAFDDNRISTDMLMDLNKDYLRDMGITILGDIIAILKHAKQVQAQLTTEQDTIKTQPVVAKATNATDTQPASGDKPARKVRIAASTFPGAAVEANPEKADSKPASKVKQRLGPPNTISFEKPKAPPLPTKAAAAAPTTKVASKPTSSLPKPIPMPVDVFDRLGPADEGRPALTAPNRIVIDNRSPPTQPGRAPPNARVVIDRKPPPPTTSEGSNKNKKYVLVSKLTDGRKVQEILKPDDPRIQKLGVTKKLVLPPGALKRATSSPALPQKEVRFPSSTKRSRITGPGDSDSDRNVMREPRSSMASRLGPRISGGGGGGDGPVARGRVARTQDAEDAVKVVKKPRAARISAPPRHYEDPEALRSNFSKRPSVPTTSRQSTGGGGMYSATPPKPQRKRIQWNEDDGSSSGDSRNVHDRIGYPKSRTSF